MSGVEDLAAWLTAIWDEEERAAQGVVDRYAPDDASIYLEDPWPEEAAYLPYIKPASMLARIAADRSILARYQRACLRADDPTEDEQVRYEWGVIASTYEEVLCELASAQADRPGFKPEWLVERQEARAVSDRRAD